MVNVKHLSTAELEAGLDYIMGSPKDGGRLALIVRRPAVDEREVLEQGELNLEEGLAGDSWKRRPSSRTVDGRAHPDMQLNVMNARAIELVAQEPERWPLAGDQLFVDLDLSVANLPVGTRLAIGSAVIEVTAQAHNGCQKFAGRFGIDALKFVNGPAHKSLRLRGINARVVQAGSIQTGDTVRKLA